MLLRELILKGFNFLVDEEHFKLNVIDITHVVKEIIYSKENISIKISVEEMENYFNIEIEYTSQKHKYCISDNLPLYKECNMYSGTKDIVYKSIFELTENYITENEFKDKVKYFYAKSKKFFKTKGALAEVIGIYGNVIKYALRNISQIK